MILNLNSGDKSQISIINFSCFTLFQILIGLLLLRIRRKNSLSIFSGSFCGKFIMFLFFMIILLTLLKVLRWWNVIFWSNSTWLMRQRRMDQCLITVDPQIDPKEVIKSHKIRTHLKIIQLLQEYCASFYHKYFYSFRIFLCCLHTIVLHTHHKNASTEYRT